MATVLTSAVTVAIPASGQAPLLRVAPEIMVGSEGGAGEAGE